MGYKNLNKNDTAEPGDVVRLKAGGLDMTVEGGTEGETKCVWFDAQNKLRRGTFRVMTLQRKV
jgi:uncharacterized protein YodC (DUF2158 family)